MSSTGLTAEDNKYLAQAIGDPLSKCLKELVMVAPTDPFEWMARWLNKFKDNNKYFLEKEKFAREMIAMRATMKQDKRTRRRTINHLKTKLSDFQSDFQSDCVSPEDSVVELTAGHKSKSKMSMVEVTVSKVASEDLTDLTEITSHTSGTGLSTRRRKRTKISRSLGSGGEVVEGFDDRSSTLSVRGGLRYRRGTNGSIRVIAPDGTEYELGPDGKMHLPKGKNTNGAPINMSKEDLAYIQSLLDLPSDSSADTVRLASEASKPKQHPGMATWGVNNRLALVCRHPVLGDMEPRPPLMYPETPEWWDRKGYLPETTYDHEVYSRTNDDVIPNWDDMEHITYKEFVTEGPWLFQGLLLNTQRSYAKMVEMPIKFKKRTRKSLDGDYFPKKHSNLDTTTPHQESSSSKSRSKNTSSIIPDSSSKGNGKKTK